MAADDPPAAAAPEGAAPKTTTSGAQGLIQANAWLTAAAVVAYTAQALWLKIRKLKKSGGNMENELDEDSIEMQDGSLQLQTETY